MKRPGRADLLLLLVKLSAELHRKLICNVLKIDAVLDNGYPKTEKKPFELGANPMRRQNAYRWHFSGVLDKVQRYLRLKNEKAKQLLEFVQMVLEYGLVLSTEAWRLLRNPVTKILEGR